MNENTTAQKPLRKKLNWYTKTIIILNALIFVVTFVFLVSLGLNTKKQSLGSFLTFAWALWALIPLLIANLAIHIIVIVKAFKSKQKAIGSLLIVSILTYPLGIGIALSLATSVFFVNPPKQKQDESEPSHDEKIANEPEHDHHDH
ncbi:Uncharacterised protein [Metamycoplasma arthritidis]|uniref:Hypothetical membrane protein n=1 Tax=Metamycoplasma arthritidis (strain 158L3-1) TaxID=243272 RepID=B3PN03_META1|nr:hypothetical protein [Metamycoplasma arthritidis]ACF07405.1 hypothetical membrane protein [Metamycoplasma arthritidis 158L3-1]VEU78927.1 Uncharacterised protein [Metamycoplasma arthritidis]